VRPHGPARCAPWDLACGAEVDVLDAFSCATWWIEVAESLFDRPLDGLRKIELASLLISFRDGDVRQARTWHARASASAQAAGDVRCTAYLERCSVLLDPASEALPHVEDALELAREHGMAGEALRCGANLGLVHLELGNWAEAERQLSACLAFLGGSPRAAALNNLGLALAAKDRAEAARHLSSALATATMAQHPAILSNLMVLSLGDEPKEPPNLDLLAATAAEHCDAALFDCVLFNHARCLADGGEAEWALDLVESREVPLEERRDGALVAGRWARLHEEICRRLGLPAPPGVREAVEALRRSCEPQAWLYRARWALCPIPLYDAPLTED
jgi:tetratricopeptide (TPR) repeat protein